MLKEIGQRLLTNLSSVGWFWISFKVTAQVIVWTSGQQVVYFGV